MRFFLPPLAFLLLLALLVPLKLYHPAEIMMRSGQSLPWEFPLLAGLAALLLARLQFSNAGTEINTFKVPGELVTNGLFRLSRNPMYLGFILLLTAAALFVNTWCALLAPFAFFLTCSLWYIPHEERAMREAFGKAYDDYAWRVRRWI